MLAGCQGPFSDASASGCDAVTLSLLSTFNGAIADAVVAPVFLLTVTAVSCKNDLFIYLIQL